MKVTSKTVYALHFLCALAIKSRNGEARPVHLREIAEEYKIPFKFLEQIAILMKSVGLVKGARGKTGGYQLSQEPESISLAQIIKSTEGELFPLAAVEGGNSVVNALLAETFQQGRMLVEEKLSTVSLADLADKARADMEPAYMMYYL